MKKWPPLSILLVASFVASTAVAQAPRPAGLEDVKKLEQTYPGLRVCDEGALPPADEKRWRRTRSRLIAKVAGARHSARDKVVAPGEAVRLSAKFAYGSSSKDLEDEYVEIFVNDCGGWKKLGREKTNDDGWISVKWPGAKRAGVYGVVFRVQGDESTVTSRIWVLPQGTQVAVFDIDGTLTTSDREIMRDVQKDYFRKIETRDYEPVSYPSAQELTWGYASRGYLIVYLSGRPYWLDGETRRWLHRHGYAPGALLITRRNRDVAPNNRGVGRFKASVLESLKKTGLVLAFAHGNATTDAYAYGEAGIPKEKTYMIGPHAGHLGTVAVTGSWQARSEAVRALAKIRQPFHPEAPGDTTGEAEGREKGGDQAEVRKERPDDSPPTPEELP